MLMLSACSASTQSTKPSKWRIETHLESKVPGSYACTPSGRCLSVVRTKSRGYEMVSFGPNLVTETWRVLSSLSPEQPIACASLSICEGFEGTDNSGGDGPVFSMLRTVDAGRHWVRQVIPRGFEPLGVACPSTLECIATGLDVHPFSTTMFLTTDGGREWTRSELPDGFSEAQRANFEVQCPSRSVCYATPFTGPNQVLVTRNFAKTWAAIPIRIPKGTYLGEMSCSTTTACTVLTSSHMGGPGAVENALWITGGGSGERMGTALPNGDFSYAGLSCISASVCEVVGYPTYGGGTHAAQTDNGGLTWTTQAFPLNVEQLGVWCKSAVECSGVGSLNGHFVITRYGA